MCIGVLLVCMYVPQKPEEALDPCELEVQTIVTCHVGVGIKPQFSVRAANALDH